MFIWLIFKHFTIAYRYVYVAKHPIEEIVHGSINSNSKPKILKLNESRAVNRTHDLNFVDPDLTI